jgi:phage-related protein
LNGIKFGGVHSSTIPITWKTNKRPFMPEPKTYYQTTSTRDSDYDFSEFNEDNRLHYNDRIFEGTISVKAKNMSEVHVLLTKVAKWLFGGWKDLEFDDMSGTIWTAKVENVENVSYELSKVGVATVYFRVKPFSRWFINSSIGGIPLSYKIPLSSKLPINLSFNPEINFINGTQQFTIKNYGDWYTSPVITVTGDFTQLTVSVDNKYYSFNGNIQEGDVLVLDCDKKMALKNGLNAMPYVSGNGFNFASGSNILTVISNGIGKLKIGFDFKFINMAVIENA